MNNLLGVDLSHHNSNVQFGEMKAAGIAFVGLKVTEGRGNIDPTFADRRPRAHQVGFGRYLLYHFFHPLETPAAQALHYTAQIGKLQSGEMIAIDLESTPGWDQLSPKESADAVIAMVAAVKAELGAKDADIVIYGSMGWLRGQFGDQLARLTLWQLWPAGGPDYNVHGAPEPDDLHFSVAPWPTWLIFQYGQYGNVEGAGDGDVDTDCWNGPIPEAT